MAIDEKADAYIFFQDWGVPANVTRRHGLNLPGITVLVDHGVVREGAYESSVQEPQTEMTVQQAQYPNPVKGDCITVGTVVNGSFTATASYIVNGAALEDDGFVLVFPVLLRNP